MAFTLATPVVAVGKLARIGKIDGAISIGIRDIARAIGVARTVVVRDVEALVAAIVHCGTHIPGIGLVAVQQLPAAIAFALKVAIKRQRSGR